MGTEGISEVQSVNSGLNHNAGKAGNELYRYSKVSSNKCNKCFPLDENLI